MTRDMMGTFIDRATGDRYIIASTTSKISSGSLKTTYRMVSIPGGIMSVDVDEDFFDQRFSIEANTHKSSASVPASSLSQKMKYKIGTRFVSRVDRETYEIKSYKIHAGSPETYNVEQQTGFHLGGVKDLAEFDLDRDYILATACPLPNSSPSSAVAGSKYGLGETFMERATCCRFEITAVLEATKGPYGSPTIYTLRKIQAPGSNLPALTITSSEIAIDLDFIPIPYSTVTSSGQQTSSNIYQDLYDSPSVDNSAQSSNNFAAKCSHTFRSSKSTPGLTKWCQACGYRE
jgi:hypothetical protein